MIKMIQKKNGVAGAVLTIGHSTRTANEFLALLQKHGVKMLIDVRTKPFSGRNPHFNLSALRKQMADAGLEFRWFGKTLGGMGGPSTKTPEFEAKMKRITEYTTEYGNVAMMCSEGDPAGCHRAMKLTAYLHRTFPGVTTRHITNNGLIDAQAFEKQQPKKWLWWEFGGLYGHPGDAKDQMSLPLAGG